MSVHAIQVGEGERFEFGKNWSHFLSTLNDERIQLAERSLLNMLGVESLRGKSFLDVGSGSGLFSLAARRLGARVHSFDFDPQSTACTLELRRRNNQDDRGWTIEEASVLDTEYVRSLGQFDIVYSWGVLHHTGRLWEALNNVQIPVAVGGTLYIAIYNDMGTQSVRWRRIKRWYNQLPRMLQTPFVLAVMSPAEFRLMARSVLSLRVWEYVRAWTQYSERRGMSRWHDMVDWVGGYPYEVARPEEIFDFYSARGFRLTRLKCGGVGLGCNEFILKRELPQRLEPPRDTASPGA